MLEPREKLRRLHKAYAEPPTAAAMRNGVLLRSRRLSESGFLNLPSKLKVRSIFFQCRKRKVLTPWRSQMIARIWRGVTRLADKDIYYDYLLKTGVPEYKETTGNRGVRVLRRVYDDKVEFLLITLWDSWNAIKAFAGEDYEKAVYYPEDEKFLLQLDPHVLHYEVLEDSLQ